MIYIYDVKKNYKLIGTLKAATSAILSLDWS